MCRSIPDHLLLVKTDFASWATTLSRLYCRGSELTKEDRESQLYDDFEHFRQNKGETIHDYYVRFAKLINDMRNIKMTMSKIQLNSKFVNNMLPEWGRFVTAVKLNKGLKDSNFDQLYAYLKQHEAHANENKMMLERLTQQTVDPLALMSNVSPQHYHSQSSTIPPTTYHQPHSADTSQSDLGLSPTDNLIENLTNILALLTQSYKTFLPQTNNQLRTSSNPRNQATVQDGRNRVGHANTGQARHVKCCNCNGVGHIARNYTQPKSPQNSEYFKDKMLLMQAKENGVVLDEEQLLFLASRQDNAIDEDVDEQPVQNLALNVDNVFQADDCDAYDSDVDEAPMTQSMFMANLSSAYPMYDEAGPSYDSDILSEVQDHDHFQDAICEHHEEHGMQDDVRKTSINAESDLREIEYLLNHDPIKDMDSILKDSVDENSPNNNLEEKIKDSKILIDELDPPRSSDFLPFPECDSVFYEDFSEVDALSSTNNEDKVFNPGFNPPLYELPFHKEVPGLGALLSFSSKNEEKVFNPRIITSKRVHTSLLPELSHRDSKAFKVIKIFESPMEIFPCFLTERTSVSWMSRVSTSIPLDKLKYGGIGSS
ncbi:hypothetical protein Tco_0821183 [Tanacetum coccineum]|uniref:Integrase, catalytic region, zinc finger, CCHC-type, peptidase aspartic, catalytic n=1 Tax=Tanacetum coccineum TaxID=301880 RepID=A0ABQ5AFU8_9ASTR